MPGMLLSAKECTHMHTCMFIQHMHLFTFYCISKIYVTLPPILDLFFFLCFNHLLQSYQLSLHSFLIFNFI